MDIQIACLCDYAADHHGKLFITGTFDSLMARGLPVVHPSCSLALRFCFTQEDIGRHRMSITIINEDGESLDAERMPLEAEFDVQFPPDLPFLSRNMVVGLQGLRFPREGLYSVDIGYDGEIVVRLPLRILQVSGQQEGAAGSA
jgi:hypothetical protein